VFYGGDPLKLVCVFVWKKEMEKEREVGCLSVAQTGTLIIIITHNFCVKSVHILCARTNLSWENGNLQFANVLNATFTRQAFQMENFIPTVQYEF